MGRSTLIITALLTICSTVFYTYGQTEKDWVDGKQYKFIDQGCWCWFQDERAVIDTVKNKLIVGTANMKSGVDLTIFDLEDMKVESRKGFGGLEYSDDHNSPGLIVMPNGTYVALWAHHYDSKHRYSICSNGNWSGEKSINWSKWGSVSDCKVAYSNLYYLSDEERLYNMGRVFDRAPNFVYSDDNGETWSYGSQLTTNSSNTYNKGYYKYWGNGKDRIDMVFTEEHPRDQETSIYHGYIQDGKMYNSDGEVADDDIYTKDKIPTFEAFTKVFEHGTDIDGVHMGRCWQHDICRYDDGTIVILFKARADDEIDDHRNFYARFDGEEWKYTYIGKAGKHIYGNEHDYVGLGSVNPDDPNRIYLCTAFNPGDDDETPSSRREIWRGTTVDDGETWTWEPVTANSSQDNFRPIVPKWAPGKEAVLWFKGDYQTAQKVYSSVYGTFYEYTPPPITSARSSHAAKTGLSSQNSMHCKTNTRGITMEYRVSNSTSVTLNVFSLDGKHFGKLFDKTVAAGIHSFEWSTGEVPAGLYLARLKVGNTMYSSMVNVQ